jgi:hypothetical protein
MNDEEKIELREKINQILLRAHFQAHSFRAVPMILSLLSLLFLATAAAAQDDEATLTIEDGILVIRTPDGKGIFFVDDLNVIEFIMSMQVRQTGPSR